MCDRIWHVISRSGVVILITNCYIGLLTYLLTYYRKYYVNYLSTIIVCWGRRDEPRTEIHHSDTRHICWLWPSLRTRAWSWQHNTTADNDQVSSSDNDLECPGTKCWQWAGLPKSFIVISLNFASDSYLVWFYSLFGHKLNLPTISCPATITVRYLYCWAALWQFEESLSVIKLY